MGYTPIQTSPAGLCLTEANWAAAGISSASFYLSALLMKPGYDCLMALPDLASYVGWKQRLILNASLPKKRSSDHYTVRSVYDGRSMSYSCDEISALITQLKPDVVVLPEGIGSSVSTATSVFRPVQEVTFETEGVYFSHDKDVSTTEFLEKINQYQDKPRYVAGDLSLALMTTLISMGVDTVESDRPAMDACLGRVYTAEGELAIQDTSHALQFEPMDSACACPTCTAGFTRAYLHHLFEHTPLLCQRLLVQHNAYYCQKNINHLRTLKIPI
jgi:queuine tRNA-ribosyltransferase